MACLLHSKLIKMIAREKGVKSEMGVPSLSPFLYTLAHFVIVIALGLIWPSVLFGQKMTEDDPRLANASSGLQKAGDEIEKLNVARAVSKWKQGQVLFYAGLAATMIGAGGLIAGHTLLVKRHEAGLPVMVPSYLVFLTGNILSLLGLNAQMNAIHTAGYTQDRNLFRISMGMLLLGGVASSLLVIGFTSGTILSSMASSVCELDPQECNSHRERDDSILRGIWAGLVVSQTLLLLSIAPRIILQHKLGKKRKLLGEALAEVPSVSYGYIPKTKMHIVGVAWAF